MSIATETRTLVQRPSLHYVSMSESGGDQSKAEKKRQVAPPKSLLLLTLCIGNIIAMRNEFSVSPARSVRLGC